MTVHNHILARHCWIFDLDGTLTVPVHDFPAIRTALGMTESDSDILKYLASLPSAEAAPKPHPEGIEKLLAAWESGPDETVMVGDYLFDLQVGRAAGTATIHVDSSCAFRWPELADLSVATLEELADAMSDDAAE